MAIFLDKRSLTKKKPGCEKKTGFLG